MRPFILVLAGVNGAGKSSVLSALLLDEGLDWFNPDRYAAGLVRELGMRLDEANGRAWRHGKSLLEGADAAQPVTPYTRGLALLALDRIPEARHAFIQFAAMSPRLVQKRLEEIRKAATSDP